MNPALRQGSALLMVASLAGCTAPEPPVLAPAAAVSAPAPTGSDDAAQRPLGETPRAAGDSTTDADADAAAPAVVSVALDHAGDVLVGQRFSEVDAEGEWHSAGLSDGEPAGACEYYERGSLPEGVAMMVEDDHVQRFDLASIDGSTEAIAQPGPFGLRLGMSEAEALKRLPPGSTRAPHAYDPETGHYLTWQDPGSDLAIRLEIFDGMISTMYWGASGAVELKEGCA
ncbi:hypothetical protein [uncultured Stenotrophomonas sp.]|uniref:hypothetical protein n=1 Tax=uncultured Stenotrophomonas sp. TaxID=165438 RepID=UPI0028F00BEF|nr:hypothetical protein [uncultured Stenotrophomonas sp.]